MLSEEELLRLLRELRDEEVCCPDHVRNNILENIRSVTIEETSVEFRFEQLDNDDDV